ncbi:hypothetical protein IJG72_03270 [bacterium]|nr:hypothetical protein [bacterium]
MENNNVKKEQVKQENLNADLLNYLQGQDKSNIDYINMLTSINEGKKDSGIKRLEAMVRSQLRKDFPGIESKKSYEILVSAIMYNYQKKALQATDDEI